MALDLGRQREQRARRPSSSAPPAHQAAGQREPADDRGRGRPEPAAVRDRRCRTRSRSPGGSRARVPRRRRASTRYDQVRSRRAGTRPRPRPRPSTCDARSPATSAVTTVVELQREPERVEAGTEVGAAWPGTRTVTGRDDERHVSAARRRAAAASTSASTTVSTRSVKVDSAVSMSLRPWPVTVTTTGLAGVASTPSAASTQQAGDPGGGGRLDEDAVASRRARAGRRGSRSSVTARNRPPDSSAAADREVPRGRVADPDRRGDRLGVGHRARRAPAARRPRPASRASAGVRVRQAGVGVLEVALPVRRDVAGVADRQHVHVGGVAEEVDDLERRGLLALEPHRVDRVDQRDRVVRRPARARSAGSRRSCRGP